MKRTDELAISQAVKAAVAERDSIDGRPCCIWCGRPSPSPLAYSNAHFISRAQGGLGVEENILTLCPDCHRIYDQTPARANMVPIFRRYLRERYPEWDENKLTFEKYGGFENA